MALDFGEIGNNDSQLSLATEVVALPFNCYRI